MARAGAVDVVRMKSHSTSAKADLHGSTSSRYRSLAPASLQKAQQGISEDEKQGYKLDA